MKAHISCIITGQTNQNVNRNIFGKSQFISRGDSKKEKTSFESEEGVVQSLSINIQSIEVHSKKIGWERLADFGNEGMYFDLMHIESLGTACIGSFPLETGTYNQLRFQLVEDSHIYLKKDNVIFKKLLSIPSGASSGIKLVSPFEVTDKGYTVITVEFDIRKSLQYNRGKGFMFQPVMKITEAKTTESTKSIIDATKGGKAAILNQIMLDIPQSALLENTEINIVPLDNKAVPCPSPFSSREALSSRYELQPDGLLFQKDCPITLYYNPTEVSGNEYDEDTLEIAYYDEIKQDWISLGGTIDKSKNTVTAKTNHFTQFVITGQGNGPAINPAEVRYAGYDPATGFSATTIPEKIVATIVPKNNTTLTSVVAHIISPNQTPASYSLPMTLNTATGEYEALLDHQKYYPELPSQSVPVYELQVYIEAVDSTGVTGVAPTKADPLDPLTWHQYQYNPDTDGDLMNDWWEFAHGLNPALNDGASDLDGDGITNVSEYQGVTDPGIFDATIGGKLTGLVQGEVVTIANKGENLSITGNGSGSDSFEFLNRVTSGSPYNVTVIAGVAGKTTTLSFASGVVAGAHITNIAIDFQDASAPITSPDITGGYFQTVQNVTLAAIDIGTGVKRVVYTTDGSIPTFAPQNGTIVNGHTAGPITMNEGVTVLRFAAEDNSGNVEPYREEVYTVSATGGLTYFASRGYVVSPGIHPTEFTSHFPSNVRSIEFDQNDGTLLVACYPYLFSTLDNGNTWERIDIDTQKYFHHSTVYKKGANVLVLRPGAGLFISQDNCKTFQKHKDSNKFENSWEMKNTGNNLYLYDLSYNAHSTYKSDDGGINFSPIYISGLQGSRILDILEDNGMIYIATGHGILFSLDGGNSYAMFPSISFYPYTYSIYIPFRGFNNIQRYRAVYKLIKDGEWLYVLTGLHILRTKDNGTNYSGFFGGQHPDSGRSIKITDMELMDGAWFVATANDGIVISYDNGNTWVARTISDGLGSMRIHCVKGVGGNIYVGTHNGISISTDMGNTFTHHVLQKNLSNEEPSDLGAVGQHLFLATREGLDVSHDFGNTFQNKAIPVDGPSLYYGFAFKKVQGGLKTMVLDERGLFGTSDFGETFYQILLNIHIRRKINDFTVVNNIMYLSVDNIYLSPGGLLISSDDGASWVEKSTSDGLSFDLSHMVVTDGLTVLSLVKCSSTSYYGPARPTQDTISISTDGGNSFSLMNWSNTPYMAITDMAVNGDLIVLGTNRSSIYISNDRGNSFTQITLATNTPMGGVKFVAIQDNKIYAYHEGGGGLYCSTDNGLSFSEIISIGHWPLKKMGYTS